MVTKKYEINDWKLNREQHHLNFMLVSSCCHDVGHDSRESSGRLFFRLTYCPVATTHELLIDVYHAAESKLSKVDGKFSQNTQNGCDSVAGTTAKGQWSLHK